MDLEQATLALQPWFPPSETGGMGMGEDWDPVLALEHSLLQLNGGWAGGGESRGSLRGS